MKITIVFKNGYSFGVTCKTFVLKKDSFGKITGCQIDGIEDCKPLYMSFEDIMCVYRDMEAEDTANDEP